MVVIKASDPRRHQERVLRGAPVAVLIPAVDWHALAVFSPLPRCGQRLNDDFAWLGSIFHDWLVYYLVPHRDRL